MAAFEAEADICVTLSRLEGRHTPSVRKLTVIGRYGEWERNVQLKDGRYVSLGTGDNVEFKKAVRFVRATLPESPDAGMRKQELIEKQRTESDGGFSVKTLERALDGLVRQEEVGEKQLMNERGKPKIYWLAYEPPGGGGEDEGIYLRQTPSPSDVDKLNRNPETGPVSPKNRPVGLNS